MKTSLENENSFLLDGYETDDFYDEYFLSDGKARSHTASIIEWLNKLSPQQLQQHQEAAQQMVSKLGVTFRVEGEDRTFPIDILPRIIAAKEWSRIERGLKQRVTALNLFCADVYGKQQIIRDRVIPENIVHSATHFLPQCQGMEPPGGVWCHVSGTDLVRDRDGTWYVLEDNLRIPSGIAYALKNRQVMEGTLPQLVEKFDPKPVADYPQQLRQTLMNSAPQGVDKPTMVVLTPGVAASAHFEHAWLAEQMGIPLVEIGDLCVKDGYLQRLTPEGEQQIDVVYQRGNLELLDNLEVEGFADGSSAIINLCQQGRLAFANAIGTGVADDKVIYAFVPEMIRYYLDQEPLLPNVPTYLCWREQDRDHVLKNLDQLVVKSASEEGGEGMLVGIHASKKEKEAFAEKIQAQPRNYIAQPTIYLSCLPTIVNRQVEGRHADLRPFILHQGEEIYVHSGGLTRVALKQGSLVVNSTQGGGSKDTWILAD